MHASQALFSLGGGARSLTEHGLLATWMCNVSPFASEDKSGSEDIDRPSLEIKAGFVHYMYFGRESRAVSNAAIPELM